MASEIKRRFTDTEMQIAKETDLPELLTYLGYQVRRIGRYHTTAEMDSLRIKDRRKWFRYSQNTGGDAITFLQQFCDKSFPEAVEYLLTFHGKARDAPVPQPKPVSRKQEFSLPTRNADDRRVFAYLHKRGIAAQVIRQFLNAGLLYEDAVHHMRKYQACGTGISQNIEDLLQSHTARTMLANSEFLIMLNQAATDREELAHLLNISDNQLSYITNVDSGRGLIKCGSAIVPFVDSFPRHTRLYQMMTTRPSDLIA